LRLAISGLKVKAKGDAKIEGYAAKKTMSSALIEKKKTNVRPTRDAIVTPVETNY